MISLQRMCFSEPASNATAVNVTLSEHLVQGTCPSKMQKMPRGGMVSACLSSPFFPPPHLLCSNMSRQQILQGAQNVVIRGGTFMTAETIHDALQCFLHPANQ